MKFALLFVVCFAAVIAFEFTEKTENSGIVFIKIQKARVSYDTYTLLYHFDLTNYLDMTKKINECMHGLEKMCSWIKHSNCELILQNLQHHFDYMKSDETDIYAYRIYQRAKRGLFNLGGKIMHWIFGLIDEDTAKEYDQKINELGNTTKREHEIQVEQLLIIKETIKMSNESFNLLNDKLNDTRKRLFEIENYTVKNIQQLKLDERFLELTNIAQLIIMEHTRLSSQILNSLESTVKGKISQLIPLQTLVEDIRKLAQVLSESQKMPIHMQTEDVLHIFKFSTIRAALIGNRLLIEMTIPVVERKEYSLYRSIPVPIKIKEQTQIVSSQPQYFLISDDLHEYILIDEDEYLTAKTNREGEMIFSPAQNVHFTHDNSCEISILMSPIKNSIKKVCKKNLIPSAVYFVAIELNSIYYIHTEKKLHILERCNGKPATMHLLSTSGYLKLDKKCKISTDSISIRPHFNTRIDSPEIIKLSETTNNITLETLSEIVEEIPPLVTIKSGNNILIQNHNEDYQKLMTKTDKLIKESTYANKFDEMNYKNYKTGIISSTISISYATLIAIIIVIITYKKFFCANTWTKLASKLEQQTQNIPKLFVRKNNEMSIDE